MKFRKVDWRSWRGSLRVLPIAIVGAILVSVDCYDLPKALSKASRFEKLSCSPEMAKASCEIAPDSNFCQLGRLLSNGPGLASFGELFERDFTSVEEAMRAVFPTAAGKALSDEPMPAATELVYSFSVFPKYPVPAPIEWAVDPNENTSWRMYFQGLRWLESVWKSKRPGQGLDAAGWVITQFADSQLFSATPADYAWNDHAVSERANQVAAFLDAYFEQAETLNIHVLDSAAKILLTHAHYLASEPCYKTKHNHGVIQDKALLGIMTRYPHWPGVANWWPLVEKRLLGQLFAVTDDGVHVENSPSYQMFFAKLLSGVLDQYAQGPRKPPDELVYARDHLLTTFVHFIQPNATLVQFGDTSNSPLHVEAGRMRDWVQSQRESGLASAIPEAVDRLDYLASHGKRGVAPDELDRVFDIAGYAAFRSSWDLAAPESVVSGHLTCGRLSKGHAHDDETSFEIFAYGSELLIDSGHYNYNKKEPKRLYEISPPAHNLLVVDGQDFDRTGDPKIVGSGGLDGSGAPWVQASHQYYRYLGIDQLVRTFGFVKPDAFVVIDSVKSESTHLYEQHFHLHPGITEVEERASGVRIGRMPEGPSVALVPLYEPDAVRVIDGWYFVKSNVSASNRDLVYSVDEGADAHLGVLILLFPPGVEPDGFSGASIAQESGQLVVRWQQNGRERQLAVPEP